MFDPYLGSSAKIFESSRQSKPPNDAMNEINGDLSSPV